MTDNYAIKGTNEFLEHIRSCWGLKSAAFIQDRDGFYLLLINQNDKAKEVHFGNADYSRNLNTELFEEIKSLVEAQGW